MIKQFLQMGGVRNENEFLAKYPTEESFFRAHPEVMQLVNQSSGFIPDYENIMPQAMYGMSYGGGYLPTAQYGMQMTSPNDPPRQEDFPDYASYKAAYNEWLSGIQQEADMAESVPQGAPQSAPMNTPITSAPVSNVNLKSYQGVSIVDFLMAQGKPADFSSRKELARSLGINNYRGTASQNAQLIQIIQQNPDLLADYNGVSQPTGGFKKAAGANINAKGAPSTQSIAQAKQAALAAPRYSALPDVTVYSSKRNPLIPKSSTNNGVTRNLTTGRWEPVLEAGPTVVNAERIELARRMNASESSRAAGLPQFNQGYAYGGTWNGNQGFEMGGAYLPDYADNAYRLPQFGLGSPVYANGGISPEEDMMMQQQAAPQEMSPEGGGQQGQFDQQQVIQAVFQMIQQGAAPEQIMQQLVQSGIPEEMAQQLIQMVMQQMQSGAEGQMGGGQPNGVQQPMAPAGPEQGMQGMPMPGGMARGGMTPGWEGEVTMQQLEELRKKGVKFDII
jgi:hypothetical protein